MTIKNDNNIIIFLKDLNELRIGYLSRIVTGKLFLEKKIYDAIAEATKALVPYVEVLYVGFIKVLCDST